MPIEKPIDKGSLNIPLGDGGSMSSTRTAIGSLLLVLLITVATALGQTSTGEVNGTVTDPSGAVVPSASVKLINQATNIETRVSPNQNGYFTFVNVAPGNYVIKVEAQGFKTAETPRF